jgi:NAD(P)H dehydrogenase (quinone)
MMNNRSIKVAVAYHSGYGHTKKIAEAVGAGVQSIQGAQAVLMDVSQVQAADWEQLAQAQAIVFGAPTYMGGPSAPFKAFADASAKVWFTQGWKDKIAGGFTCSQNMSGDKLSTLNYFSVLAMQHAMIWVGTGLPPPAKPGDPNALNRLGSSVGVMAQADNVPPEQSPPQGDVDTGFAYGARIAQLAQRLG